MAQALRGLDRETLDLTLAAFRDFARDHLPDARLIDLDTRDEFPNETVRSLGGEGLGIQLAFIPEAYGGMGGGAFDVYRICEALARVDVGVATGVLATFLGSDPIVYGGTPEQQARWLGRIANEGILMAYGATEPEAGSDLGTLRSTAEPVREHGVVVGYRLNGNKQWISNGGFADVYTFLANAPGGPSWFVVERGAKGLSHGKPEDKHGIRLSNTATVHCEDVYVDADRLVGEVEGQGLVQAQLVFGFTRLMVAAFGLGGGWAAVDRAIAYSLERVQGGGLLATKQGYTHKLIVPHVVQLEGARAFIEETAERIDAGEGTLNTEGAISKYLATEAGNNAAEAAIQAHGGYGYTKEYMVEKIKRDVRITTIYEGTSEIMEMTIARDRWQIQIKSRGQHYHAQARELEQLHARQPAVGADVAALAAHALAEVLEAARVARLTRHQHVLFRVGELVAFVEAAGAFARRAARAAEGELPEKTDRRFDATVLATMSRVFARKVALKVVLEGPQWVAGADGLPDSEGPAFAQRCGLAAVQGAQRGLIADMDRVADALYQRG
ncbi:MAG: acyl-CoA dehydrogenase family protein [Proteobacteria bacterium]|nr:acyl-CoA dehydrogenase family protein [Pseudomonadota bacterium]